MAIGPGGVSERGPDPTVRAFAVKISQAVAERGAIVVFSPTHPSPLADRLVEELGRTFALRGENVLVFDARAFQSRSDVGSLTHLVDDRRVEAYLDGATDDPNDCFRPTDLPTLEYTAAELSGRLNGGMQGMYRFRRLVDEVRSRYSMTLMIADSDPRGEDAEYLNAVAEGIVLVVPEGANADEANASADRLKLIRAPLWGSVVVTEETF